MTYLDGLVLADEKGHIVQEYDSPLKSFSICTEEFCAIAINSNLLITNERSTALFHELGHCETGSFYNQWASRDVRKKHENRANKWAIKMLIPEDELKTAISDGRTEIWELAEYFSVTEDFMRKAVCWYQNGNLDTEYYK